MKSIKKLFAVVLAFALCLVLLACNDVSIKTVEGKDIEESAVEQTAPETSNDTEPSKYAPSLDNKQTAAFEEAANKALMSDNTLTAYTDIVMYINFNSIDMEQVCIVSNNVQAANGTSLYSSSVTSIEQGDELLVESIYETAIIGNKLYTSSYEYPDGEETIYLLITGANSELQKLGDFNFSIDFSVDDFYSVQQKTGTGKTETYVCQRLKASAAYEYNALVEEMVANMYESATVKLNDDTIKYTVELVDGKYQKLKIEMSMDAQIWVDNTLVSVTYDYVVEQEFDYSTPTVTVPEDWYYIYEYYEMTLEEYLELIQ